MTGISIWQWLPFQRWRKVATVESADEIPDRLPRNGAVAVGDSMRSKWIAFDCPCRRGHRIMLNTDSGRRPTWSVSEPGRNRLTIAPSIDARSDGRRCHYHIRGGRVIWDQDSDR
jgi:hypothetical protein